MLIATSDSHDESSYRWCPIEREDIVNMLLKEGADPNMANSRGTTALMNASESAHDKLLRLLLNASADHAIANK